MKKDSSSKQVFGWIRVNGVLTFGRCSIARESGEPSETEKLETASAGASVNFVHPWHTVSWRVAREHVRGLQMRIAKAVKGNDWGKVQTLQRLLTNSFYAKLLAVKRVTSKIRIIFITNIILVKYLKLMILRVTKSLLNVLKMK